MNESWSTHVLFHSPPQVGEISHAGELSAQTHTVSEWLKLHSLSLCKLMMRVSASHSLLSPLPVAQWVGEAVIDSSVQPLRSDSQSKWVKGSPLTRTLMGSLPAMHWVGEAVIDSPTQSLRVGT